MNDQWPAAWVILIGAASGVAISPVFLLLLNDTDPAAMVSLVSLAAVLGAALGWLWTRLA